MILINNQWEQIKDLSDIIRIVKENIGNEFAKEVERICGEPSLDLEERNFMLQNRISNMEDCIKEAKKIFLEVLNIADGSLENNEYDEFVEEFDNAIGGDTY